MKSELWVSLNTGLSNGVMHGSANVYIAWREQPDGTKLPDKATFLRPDEKFSSEMHFSA